MAKPSVLMLFLEPAPYIIAFVEAARRIWPGRIDVLYAAAQISQDWGTRIGGEGDVVLPSSQRLAMVEIKRRISSGRYALVHLAGWGHPLLWRTMLYAARRIPVTVQTDTPAPRGEPAWKRLVKRALYGALFRIPAMFTPAGTPQADYVRSFGVSRSRIQAAQLTVDTASISAFADAMTKQQLTAARQRLGLSDDDVAVLYLGRLEPHKGIEDLVSAFQAVAANNPRTHLLVAGDGSLRTRVTAAAAEVPNLHYLGRLSGEAVWEAYKIAELFVLPSHFEPWGLVVNEAMAAGLPVVVTDQVGCAADLVQEGGNGFIVPTGSPDVLAQAVGKLAGDADLRRVMAEQSRRRIAGWTIANQANRTLSAWLDVLRESAGKAA